MEKPIRTLPEIFNEIEARKHLRRKIEDALRKTASDSELYQTALILGVKL